VAKRLADPNEAAHEMAQDQEPGVHQQEGRAELFNREGSEMSGRQRLPAGEPRKASQRRTRRAALSKVNVNPVWRPGDKVLWDRIGDFQRSLGDGEHAEIMISGRTYRLRLGELA
jgi:hypothetical protein